MKYCGSSCKPGDRGNLISWLFFFSISYLAVKSSTEAVLVLCRRGDQSSLKTALQVLNLPVNLSPKIELKSWCLRQSSFSLSKLPRIRLNGILNF